jgi:hypothetical protein
MVQSAVVTVINQTYEQDFRGGALNGQPYRDGLLTPT